MLIPIFVALIGASTMFGLWQNSATAGCTVWFIGLFILQCPYLWREK